MPGIVPKIESKYVRVREQALYFLLVWEETAGIGATINRLVEGLDRCGMKNIVSEYDGVVLILEEAALLRCNQTLGLPPLMLL